MDISTALEEKEKGSIIIHELDENRVLSIAVPESDESKIGIYISKIKKKPLN